MMMSNRVTQALLCALTFSFVLGLAATNADAACRNIGLSCGATVSENTGGDGNNFDLSCDGDGNCSNDVEWFFQAPVSGTYNFNTNASSFDTVLSIRSGNCGSIGGQLACNDDGGSGNRSSINIFLSAGQQVVAIVDGFSNDSFAFFGSECSGNGGNAVLQVIAPGGCFICGNGSLEGPEQCETPFGACCNTSTCTFNSGNVCRSGSADGFCDPAEVCPGNSANCPGNFVRPNSTVCRAGSGDVCDPTEFCSGVAGQSCPGNSIQPAGTVCRAGSGDPNGSGFVCDPDEVCSGITGQACPANTITSGGTVCNSGSGDSCDPAETCPGTAGGACPADSFASAATVCRAGSGDPNGSGFTCDPTEFCPGVADAACPTDSISGAGTVCNAGSGDLCDQDEVCSGASQDPCPADTITSAGTVCRAGSGDPNGSGTVCDPTEVCTGNADEACPADVNLGAGATCRAGSGDPNGSGFVCDPDEVCPGGNGPAAACPTDTLSGAGTVCNAGSGDPNGSGFVCDPDETCSGTPGVACPADTFSNGATVCNAGGGDPNGSGFICDPDELCPGTADGACPADDIEPATTVCNAGSGDPNGSGFTCDPDEFCTGNAEEACPADTLSGAGTVCNPGSGDPNGSGVICDPEEVCSGNADEACPADNILASGTLCRIGLSECDTSESCSGAADDPCGANINYPDGTSCYTGNGIPDPHNPAPTDLPLPCNDGECVCLGGRCIGPGQDMLVLDKAKMKVSKASKDTGLARIEGLIQDEETEPAVFGGDFRQQLLAGNIEVFISDDAGFQTTFPITGCLEGATGILIRCKDGNLKATFRLTNAGPVAYDMKLNLKGVPLGDTGPGALVAPITASLFQGSDPFYRVERAGNIGVVAGVCKVSGSGKSMKCKEPKELN